MARGLGRRVSKPRVPTEEGLFQWNEGRGGPLSNSRTPARGFSDSERSKPLHRWLPVTEPIVRRIFGALSYREISDSAIGARRSKSPPGVSTQTRIARFSVYLRVTPCAVCRSHRAPRWTSHRHDSFLPRAVSPEHPPTCEFGTRTSTVDGASSSKRTAKLRATYRVRS